MKITTNSVNQLLAASDEGKIYKVEESREHSANEEIPTIFSLRKMRNNVDSEIICAMTSLDELMDYIQFELNIKL